MNARDEILERIRRSTSLASAQATTAREPGSRSQTPRGLLASESATDLVDRFHERVADYGARVMRVDHAGLPQLLAELVSERPGCAVVTAEGLDERWIRGLASSAQVVSEAGLDTAALDRIDGAVTGARLGIAETGTIVLDHGPGQGRRAISLVPDLHVCVIEASQVVPDVPSAIAELRPDRRPAPLTWISGPSATSDIELQRVEGVHGPRTLVVVIVEASQPLPSQPSLI